MFKFLVPKVPVPPVNPGKIDFGVQKIVVDLDDVFSFLKKVVEVKFGDPKGCEDPCDSDCDDKFVIDGNTTVSRGTSGNDEIRVREGNQTIYGDDGDDTIAGGPGNDQLSGGAGNDSISGDRDADIVCGGSGNDLLLGNGGTDKLYGGCGNDTIFGGLDDDLMEGGSGKDRLQGDAGNDKLRGGANSDTFVFKTGDGKDVIKDFDDSGSDQDFIDLSAMGNAFDTFAEVRAATTQTSAGALIDFGNGQSLLLENLRVGDLHSASFIL